MYNYDYAYAAEESIEGVLGMLGFQLMANSMSFIISIVSYVLLSLGMYTIAKRRGIKNPWLAWIPVGDIWILGCISDQYRYVARGEVKSKRKWMMALYIVMLVCLVLMIVVLTGMIINLITMGAVNDPYMDDAAMATSMLGGLFGILGLFFILLIPAIVLTVLQYMALYDLFASCEPDNKVLYLVLGILFGITTSIFVFVCRKKDLGMPPRRDEVPQQPPVVQPEGQYSLEQSVAPVVEENVDAPVVEEQPVVESPVEPAPVVEEQPVVESPAEQETEE